MSHLKNTLQTIQNTPHRGVFAAISNWKTTFEKFSNRVHNRFTNRAEGNADFNFTTVINAENLVVSWRILNINQCPQQNGEFYESPPFSTGFSKELKWVLRLYPRGRKVRDEVGIFIYTKAPDESTRVKYDCEAVVILESSNHSQQKHDYSFSNHKKVCKLGEKRELEEESGIDNIFLSTNLIHFKSLTIRCHLKTIFEDVYDCGLFTSESSKSLCSDFKVLFDTAKFADSKIQVGKESFPVHKAVLAARSEVFEAMFKHNMMEKESDTVAIDDFEPAIIKSLLQYIYTGKFEDLTVDKAIGLYPAADKYCVGELMKLCVEVLMKKMNPDNVCQIAILADVHCVPKLKTATNYCFRLFKNEILQKKQWKKLIKERPQLASDILGAISIDLVSEFTKKD